MSVLLIEDNPTDVFVVTQVLKEMGLDKAVQVASDGERALRVWQNIESDLTKRPPHMVLLDLNLPRVSGVEVLTRIRSSPRCPEVPVIIITSSGSQEDMDAAHTLRASAYFRKPSDLSEYMELVTIIRQVLPPHLLPGGPKES